MFLVSSGVCQFLYRAIEAKTVQRGKKIRGKSKKQEAKSTLEMTFTTSLHIRFYL